MNESILTQLKILIERAVRPIRASTSRKRKMREELLAHVVEVFQEEAVKLGDGTLLYCGGTALSLFSMVFGFYFFEDWMRQALFGRRGRSWPRAALVAMACSVFYSGMTFLPGIQGDAVDAWSLAFTTMFFGVAMASLVITLAKFGALRTRYLEEWSRLPVEPSS